MPPAIIGGAIAAVGALGAAKIGSSAANKVGKTQAQSADKTEATTRQIYSENKATLAPFVNQGAPASYAINSFLGLTPEQPQQTMQQPNALAQFQGQSYGFEGMDGPGRFFSAQEPDVYGANSIGGAPWGGGPFQQVQQTQQPGMINGRDAFKSFIDNSDYGFQFGQGANKVNSGYAGAGTLQSGAAMKALEDYRQNLQSGYRGEFLNALGNQQGVGLSAAGAQAGVGTNFANSLGTINQNKADALSNVALLKAQNTGQAINSLATIGSNIFGSR